MGFICHLLPIAPELDGDIDLTRQSPPSNPALPAPETQQAPNVCAIGCPTLSEAE